MNKKNVSIHNRDLAITNPGKVLYPRSGLTKVQMLEYYSRIARFILPHLKNRALTLKRYPEGVDHEFFFEKRCPPSHPDWVETAEIPYGENKKIKYCLVNNLETLIWVANLASLELHVPLAKAKTHQTPDTVVFDLDPGVGADIVDCGRVALVLKDLLAKQKLACWAKTSGKKGLHLLVPLNSKGVTFEQTKRFSRAVAEIMERHYPELVTADMDKVLRPGKVFINWSQNDRSKTTVCVYSLRAADQPYVSFPLEWRQVEQLVKLKKPAGFPVLYSEAVTRAEKEGDLFLKVLSQKQKLPNI